MTPMNRVSSASHWRTHTPAACGLRAEAVDAAIAWHRALGSTWPRDFVTLEGRFVGVADQPPTPHVLGPLRRREEPNGLIVRGEDLVAEWSDTPRVDMSFGFITLRLEDVSA